MPAKKPSEEVTEVIGEAQPIITEAPAATQPEQRVVVRVLVNGTKVAGGIAAKGKRLNVKLSDAKTLESLGKVQILGV